MYLMKKNRVASWFLPPSSSTQWSSKLPLDWNSDALALSESLTQLVWGRQPGPWDFVTAPR